MTGVCPEPGCPRLNPCPTHGRDRNAPRNPRRDLNAHKRWARALKHAAGHRCQGCGATTLLEAHHTHGINDPRGVVLCNACHVAIDPHARTR